MLLLAVPPVSLGAGTCFSGAGTYDLRLCVGLCCCGSPADPGVCHGAPQGARGHSLSHPQAVCAQRTLLEDSPWNISFQTQERSNQTLTNPAQRNPKGLNSQVLGGTWQI